MTSRRRSTILALTLAALFLLGGPAHAQDSAAEDSSEPFVVLTGRLDVAQDHTVGDAVIFNGSADIAGTVQDNVVAFNGDVLVSGSVGGDVVALNGTVTVTSGAHVGGNVESQRAADVAPGTVSGEVRRISGYRGGDLKLAYLGRVFIWLVATGSSFLLGLVLTLWMPRAADALASTSSRRMGASFGFGALWFFAIPVAGGLLAVTVLAGLVGLGILLGSVLIYSVAYAIGAFLLGRRILPTRNRFASFLLGWGILRVIALLPVLGGIAWVVASMFGLGAFMLTAWRAARGTPSSSFPGSSVAPLGPQGDATIPPAPPMPL